MSFGETLRFRDSCFNDFIVQREMEKGLCENLIVRYLILVCFIGNCTSLLDQHDAPSCALDVDENRAEGRQSDGLRCLRLSRQPAKK